MFRWRALGWGSTSTTTEEASSSATSTAVESHLDRRQGHRSGPIEPQQQIAFSWMKPWTWRSRPSGACCNCSGAQTQEGHERRCRSGLTDGGMPLSRFPAASFDTVVDAFGLCSHEDPVQVLREASRVCRPDGRILLLEHGRSHYDWLNGRLDGSAEKHYGKW